MQERFLGFVKGVSIFLICAESILHFVPNDNYRKYVKMIVNLMVLSLFVLPIKALISGNEMVNIEQQIKEFQDKMEAGTKEVSLKVQPADVYDSVKEEMIIALNGLKEIGEYQVVGIDFSVTEGTAKEVGENVDGIVIRIGKKGEENRGETASVQPVQIEEIRISTEDSRTGQEDKQTGDGELDRMKDIFCRALGTDPAYVEVRWDE